MMSLDEHRVDLTRHVLFGSRPELAFSEQNDPAMGRPVDTAPPEPLFRRHRRAAALITLAALVIVFASAGYLRSTAPEFRARSSAAIDPMLVTSYVVSYDFATPSLGWAAVALSGNSTAAKPFDVFWTVDGAKHWTLQFQSRVTFVHLLPFSVKLFEKGRGFMIVGSPVQQLYRTPDAGARWDLLRLPASPRIDNVAFSDPSHGWLFAASASTASGVLNLYATGDGGDSWQRLPDPPGDAGNLSFRSPSEAWLGSTGPGPPHVYTSSDAGKSWQPHDIPMASGGPWDATAGPFQVTAQLLPGTGVIMSALCVCAQSGLFDFTSFDGGFNWKLVRPEKGSVAYQDGLHWWDIDGRVLLKSADAGQTWTQITDKLPDWHYLPHVLDSRHAWAVLVTPVGGGLGLTGDGGLHWTRGTVPQVT